MGKRYEQTFHGKISVNTSSCIKRWSNSLLIRRVQTKTTLRYEFLLIKLANYQMFFAVCGRIDILLLRE